MVTGQHWGSAAAELSRMARYCLQVTRLAGGRRQRHQEHWLAIRPPAEWPCRPRPHHRLSRRKPPIQAGFWRRTAPGSSAHTAEEKSRPVPRQTMPNHPGPGSHQGACRLCRSIPSTTGPRRFPRWSDRHGPERTRRAIANSGVHQTAASRLCGAGRRPLSGPSNVRRYYSPMRYGRGVCRDPLLHRQRDAGAAQSRPRRHAQKPA